MSAPSPKARIVKVEEDKQLVFGWASIINTENGDLLLDRQNDFVDDPSELEKSAYNYVLHSRDGGEMHVRKGVSTLVESVVLTEEKQQALGIAPNTVPTGWWIGFKVNDGKVWEQVKKGDYTGFSVHGTGRREPITLDRIGKYTEVGKAAGPKEKISKYIKQKSDGSWCVYSESGKILGEYKSKEQAQKRLKQIERFSKGQPSVSEVHEESTDWASLKKKRKRKAKKVLSKFNPYHGADGRFTTAENSITSVFGTDLTRRVATKEEIDSVVQRMKESKIAREAHYNKLRQRGNVKVVEVSRPTKSQRRGSTGGKGGASGAKKKYEVKLTYTIKDRETVEVKADNEYDAESKYKRGRGTSGAGTDIEWSDISIREAGEGKYKVEASWSYQDSEYVEVEADSIIAAKKMAPKMGSGPSETASQVYQIADSSVEVSSVYEIS
jgi:hypothetical protein